MIEVPSQNAVAPVLRQPDSNTVPLPGNEPAVVTRASIL